MSNATNQPVLVLNHSFEPISIAAARRALCLVVSGKAIVQEHNGRQVTDTIMFPVVIRLSHYTYVPARRQVLSRRNLFARDRGCCCYCGVDLKNSFFTLDHIIPKSKGGPNTWENLVTCCQKCNRRKGDRSLEESGMTLLRRPRPATIHTSRHIMRGLGTEERQWQKYLYFDSEEHAELVTRN